MPAETGLTQLKMDDGTWATLKAKWADQCSRFGEDLAGYLAGTIELLDELVENPLPRAGVFSCGEDVICQLNSTLLPGYDGYVLRCRFITLSPQIDLGEVGVEEYTTAIVDIVSGVINMAISGALRSPHIKFHLRSPTDRAFFATLGAGLGDARAFTSVKMSGSWLYITI